MKAMMKAGLAGVLVCALIAAVSRGLAAQPALTHLGVDALTVAIALGLLLGNLVPRRLHAITAGGAAFCQGWLLEIGIALFGLHLTLQQVAEVGIRGIAVDVLVIGTVLTVGLVVGIRVLRLDRDTALLVTLGSAICGAAAVMGAAPMLRAPAHKVAVAVATVTVFGTCAIFLYPLIFPYLGMDPAQFGVFVGSTVHAVSQVVAAASPLSQASSDEAVIVKLIRVMMLAPVLLVVSRVIAPADDGLENDVRRLAPGMPLFILAFVVVVGVNSLAVMPAPVQHTLLQVDDWLLALAMAGLGWSSRAAMLRQAGYRPLLLGAMLFLCLVLGGYGINRLVTSLLA